MAKYDANLIVIGAGSGGLVSAYIAAATKAKVILIERDKMGGDCLNTGCVPSKALIASAKFVHEAKHADNYGMKSAQVDFDFADVMERVASIVKKIEPHDSVERYEGLGVDVVQGEAKVLSPHTVSVNGKTLSARSIIIAAGARPFVPPIPGLDQVDYLTSDNIWDMRELPKRMVVLGGGPIGCELAQCFARFGSETSIVEMQSQLLIREDDEVIEAMESKLAGEGLNILTDHKALEVVVEGDNKTLVCEHQGNQVRIPFDAILVAVGRAARLTDYGLENLNTKLSKRRTIEVNDYLQAGHSSVYAVGDVVGPYQFTHAAAHQAWFAAVNALFKPYRVKVDYSVMPWATYTDPEIARVGLNEKDAKEQGIAYEVTRYPLSDLDRAIADGHAEGEIKVLTVPGKGDILGVTIMGKHAGDLNAEFVFAMKHKLGLNDILGTIHSYPTWMEANKFAAGNWRKAQTKQWQLNFLEKFHRWRR